jgi:hypothetical protein
MVSVWILVVVTYVNSGAVIFSQEFNSREKCEILSSKITKNKSVEMIGCVEK